MMVQSAPDGGAHFVITMDEHTTFAGLLARAFGNETFEPVAPRDEMLWVVDYHDRGWQELDAEAALDPKTGLPYNLTQTPFGDIIKTSNKSPSFNQNHHAYCGLISSMHSWGLYNGRYGMSDHVLLDSIAVENRGIADSMLDDELKRQEELKAELAKDATTAAWVESDHLMQNYKQLQFFDTVALYFNLKHAGIRGEASFEHVPRSATDDATIALREEGEGTYSFSPYPFVKDGLELWFTGHYLEPQTKGTKADLQEILATTPVSTQTVRFVAG